MKSDSPINVLYVDDEENNLISFKAAFRRYFSVFSAISVQEAIEILNHNEIHVLITDQRMPGTLGTELLAESAKNYPDQIRILLTGFSDIEALKDAVNRGHIFRYLEKPWNDEDLKKTIEESFDVYNIKKEQEELNQKILLTNEQLEFMLRQKLIS
ncbi:MAG: response regulator [Bacteroidetes bacterium]|nr:response regulator [Bacteroidota bacterium]